MMPALLPLLLGTLLHPCQALMFHSGAVSKEWDTWVFVENGTFYAYYLVTEVSYGEGFGVATSTDGQHFTDHGYVWKGPSWWNAKEIKREGGKFWEGSSAVWRAADFNTTGRYLINYSVMDTICGCQNITFAESYDLIHWTNGLEKNETNKYPWFDIDPSLYKAKGGRWDTIYSIPVPGPGQENERDGYPRYGFWTASPINNSGTFGLGITHDGFSWEAMPSPKMLPEPIGAELGAVEYVREGVYVAMLGYGWPRTMLAYTAPSPLGPFTRNSKNVNFLNGSCYYSRFFRGPEQELLVTHQTWDNHGTHYSYVSPFKLGTVDEEGTFRLKWWPKNENLKGEALPGGTANVSQGMILEANLTIPATADPTTWPGFLIETEVPGATFVGMDHEGIATVGTYKSTSPSQNINWTSSTTPQPVPALFEYANGAAVTPSKLKGGGSDIRSGGPGQTSLALVAHPLASLGRTITGATVSFQYISGYGCEVGACSGAANVSLAVVDAFNHSVIATLWESLPLNNASYDRFNGYSLPVSGGNSGVAIAWPRQCQLALVLHNNQRNLQIPISSVVLTVTWGTTLGPAGWHPESLTTLKTNERWSRDLSFAPGQVVAARLLYRRSMLEMYINDHLYPVYAMPAATGGFGASNGTVVTGLKAWKMSLPADSNPGQLALRR